MITTRSFSLDHCLNCVYAWLITSDDPVPPKHAAFKLRGAAKGQGKAPSFQGKTIAQWFFSTQLERRFGVFIPRPRLSGWHWPVYRDENRFLMFAGARTESGYFWRAMMMDRGAIWCNASGDCGCTIPIQAEDLPTSSDIKPQGLYTSVVLTCVGGISIEQYVADLPYPKAGRSIQALAAQNPPLGQPDCCQLKRRLCEYCDLLDDAALWHGMEYSAHSQRMALEFTDEIF